MEAGKAKTGGVLGLGLLAVLGKSCMKEAPVISHLLSPTAVHAAEGAASHALPAAAEAVSHAAPTLAADAAHVLPNVAGAAAHEAAPLVAEHGGDAMKAGSNLLKPLSARERAEAIARNLRTIAQTEARRRRMMGANQDSEKGERKEGS